MLVLFSILGVYGMGAIVYGLGKLEHDPDKSTEALVNSKNIGWGYTEKDNHEQSV